MRPENKKYLEENIGHWELFKSDQVLRNGFDYDRALIIAREEWDSKAMFCTTCPHDKPNLLKFVYTQYEKLYPSNLPDRS